MLCIASWHFLTCSACSIVCLEASSHTVQVDHAAVFIQPIILLTESAGGVCRETEPGWEQDIAEDVKDECQKYGAVVHAFVDRSSRVNLYGHS